MEIVATMELGKVDFFGQQATVYREIYTSGIWKFVVITNNNRIVLMSY